MWQRISRLASPDRGGYVQAMARGAKTSGAGGEAVEAAMAQDIQSGLLPAGSWLKQIDLERRYGCSRNEIRRALDKLTTRRLVQHIPERGYYVCMPDDRRKQELREIRAILESAMVDFLMEAATPEAVAELRRLAQRFAEASVSGTHLERYETNREFHVYLTGLCRNHELAALIIDLRGHLPATPLVQWHNKARIEQSSAEHFAMVEALEARDAPGLKALLSAHIRQPETR